tara:strand:+ start:2776 stop:3048 length:273 start_codon:yes stop_codon:yes gene_type:complete
MINLNESTFFFILFLTGIITYIVFILNQNCDIKCKINYYKYENYFKNEIIQDLNYHNINSNDLNVVQTENDEKYTEDDLYLKEILNQKLF